MMMQISELVKAQGGLVLSRKETKASGNGGCPYKRLTLRALTEDGEIDSSALEDFCASETWRCCDTALFTAVPRSD